MKSLENIISKTKKSLAYAGIVGLALAAGAREANAAIYHVNPTESIQDAIDDPNVVAGDEIRVAPGTYYENINFNGKNIILRSMNPNNPHVVAATIIDGNQNGPVVTFNSGENADCVLNGFTITNGYASGDWPEDRGGGIYCKESSPTIINCIITYNSADVGGGMSNYRSSPTLTNCTFSNNYAGYDAGMVNYDNSSPTLTNCTFSNNQARYDAGGMCNIDSNPTLTNCTFSGNSARHSGGGMTNYRSNPTLTNSTFSNNYAGYGGGMLNYDNGNPTLINCIFSGNHSWIWGGGMLNERDSNPTLTNCTFNGNSARYGAGGGMFNRENSSPTLTNCILWGDMPEEIYLHGSSMVVVTYSNVQGGWEGEGNINADPCFVEPGYWEDPCNTPTDPWDDFWIDGDYHLLPDSPCINTGNPKHPHYPGQTDIEGQPRIMGGRIDMGADEYEDEYAPPAHNITQNTCFETIQDAIDDANNLDEIVVSAYTFYENINFGGKNIILRSTDPTNPNIVAWTVIDGRLGDPWGSGSVVTFAGTESPDCVISGFTITNGSGNGDSFDRYGGGVYGYGALATIQHNFISENLAVPYGWPSHGRGGGIYDCDGTIQYNIISKNGASGMEGGAHGGGLYGCDGIIEHNIISGNRVGGYDSGGGGLYNCNGTIQNNIIFGNIGHWYGGGLSECDGIIINCIIWGNSAAQGAQLSGYSIPSYSCIQDWTGGGIGNISEDPCFVSPGYWDPNGTPDVWWDDFWVDGNYHLKSQGWRWDSDANQWTWDDVTSRCIDAGNPGSPLGDEPITLDVDPLNRFGQNLRINMGAYGGTAEASMPPYDWALLADLTNDGTVDFADLAHWTENWLSSGSKQPGDLDRNGIVDMLDYALFAQNCFLETTWHE